MLESTCGGVGLWSLQHKEVGTSHYHSVTKNLSLKTVGNDARENTGT